MAMEGAQLRRRLGRTVQHLQPAAAAAWAAGAAAATGSENIVELPEVIFTVRADGVAIITLNNPTQLNPMGMKMLQGFHRALRQVEDPKSGIRALLITGAGRGFCSGANLTGAHVLDTLI